jgi:hypothetical protein
VPTGAGLSALQLLHAVLANQSAYVPKFRPN